MARSPLTTSALLTVLLTSACAGSTATTTSTTDTTSPTVTAAPTTAPTSSTAPPTTTPQPTTTPSPPTTTTLPPGVIPPPEWLGTRVLPERPDGFGEVQPTPEELTDRRLATVDLLPPPDGDDFASTIGDVPDEVAARSTWSPDCPVSLEDLRYVTATFWGFDERPHTGELIVNARAADGIVEVLRQLYESRFPIEEMRVVDAAELDLPPTGDGNNTTSFVCRPVVGATSWSQHAYGLAIDINPFHNPYQRGDVVLPELASAYLDRGLVRTGMILGDEAVVAAFTAIGWGWGGDWSSTVDYMHFSESGR